VIFEPGKKKNLYFHYVLNQHRHTYPIALPVRRNQQHRSSWLLSQILPHFRFNLFVIKRNVSRPSFEPLYITDTSHCKQEIFLYEYPLHWVLLPTERWSSVVYSTTVAILTTEISLWTCASDTYTVMKLDCATTQWYAQKTYYVHYRCFTSICDLFTDCLV
jgi:hypothetical protein